MNATTHVASKPRLDFLDAARAFALLLGIVFHAGLSFVPVFIGWAVMDISTSPVVSTFTLVSHSFRMPLFFLLAGFFGHMVFHRKGAGPFMLSRLKRIALPFAAGWFLLYPLIASGWVIGGQSLAGDVDILAGLSDGFARLGELPGGLWVGTHLWFLYYLLLAQACVLLLRALARVTGLHGALARGLDGAMARLAGSWIAWPILAIPTAGCLWYMSHWGLDTPDRSLVPHVPVLLLYGGFFSFGWLLHRLAGGVERFARVSIGGVVLSILAIGLRRGAVRVPAQLRESEPETCSRRVRRGLRADDVVLGRADPGGCQAAARPSERDGALHLRRLLLALPGAPADRGLAPGGGCRVAPPLVAEAGVDLPDNRRPVAAGLRPVRAQQLARGDPQRQA